MNNLEHLNQILPSGTEVVNHNNVKLTDSEYQELIYLCKDVRNHIRLNKNLRFPGKHLLPLSKKVNVDVGLIHIPENGKRLIYLRPSN